MVEELAATSWRLKRAHRIETAILAEIAAGSPDPDAAIASVSQFMQTTPEIAIAAGQPLPQDCGAAL